MQFGKSKRDRRRYDQRLYGALPLSYGPAMESSWAGGTRTHDTRLLKHVLRIGSRSCIVGDEVLTRHFRKGIEPSDRQAISKRIGLRRCSPDRQSPCFVKARRSGRRDCRSYQPLPQLAVGTHGCIYERRSRAHYLRSPEDRYLRTVIVTM